MESLSVHYTYSPMSYHLVDIVQRHMVSALPPPPPCPGTSTVLLCGQCVWFLGGVFKPKKPWTQGLALAHGHEQPRTAGKKHSGIAPGDVCPFVCYSGQMHTKGQTCVVM